MNSDPINTVYRYNPNGKLSIRITDNSSLISRELYSYDTEQRLKSLITSNSNKRLIDLAYEYNDAQQITQILERVLVDNNVFRSSTNAFIYDKRDQLSNEYHYSTIATLQYTNIFTYDNAQNRTTRTLEGRGETSKTDTYFYAVANKLKAIDETKQYDDDGVSVSDELYHGTDPCDSDTDSDGWDDDYEINTSNTNPWDPDSDGDRILDGSDSQPLIPNSGMWFSARTNAMPRHWWTGSTSKPIYLGERGRT